MEGHSKKTAPVYMTATLMNGFLQCFSGKSNSSGQNIQSKGEEENNLKLFL